MARRTRSQDFKSEPGLLQLVFREVRRTGRQLGAGCYGSVVELEVNGQLYAGRQLHEAFVKNTDSARRKLTAELQVSAEFHDTLHHALLVIHSKKKNVRAKFYRLHAGWISSLCTTMNGCGCSHSTCKVT